MLKLRSADTQMKSDSLDSGCQMKYVLKYKFWTLQNQTGFLLPADSTRLCPKPLTPQNPCLAKLVLILADRLSINIYTVVLPLHPISRGSTSNVEFVE